MHELLRMLNICYENSRTRRSPWNVCLKIYEFLEAFDPWNVCFKNPGIP